MIGRGDLEDILLTLLGGVGDLAMVEDQGVAVGTAFLVGPANALGEPGLRVRKEELERELASSSFRPRWRMHTMSSPVTPLALPQALMT